VAIAGVDCFGAWFVGCVKSLASRWFEIATISRNDCWFAVAIPRVILCGSVIGMNAYRFQIPLVSPLKLKGQTYNKREGVLLERDGQWAEASPLPGFSAETIDDVIAALRGTQESPASLKFAMSALSETFSAPIEVPWNYLLLGDRDQVLSGVEKCKASGCRAVKLKVGSLELHAAISLVREVRELLPDNVQLRLDANQAWTLQDATKFCNELDDIETEYIEEPLQDSSRLEELYSRTGVNYALDETLLHHDSLDPWPNAAALICKPTILGDRQAVERLAATGKPIVFSAAFESGVGIARIVQLAAEFSPQVPAGLDTLDWLTDDLLQSSPVKRNGMFAIMEEPCVDATLLERIEL